MENNSSSTPSSKVVHLIFSGVLNNPKDPLSSHYQLVGDSAKVEMWQWYESYLKEHGYEPKVHPVRLDNYKQVIQNDIGTPDTPDYIIQICDGLEDVDGYPGLSVISFLEEEGYCFAGPNTTFAKAVGDKQAMKKIFQANNIPTAPFVNISEWNDDIEREIINNNMKYPLLVKVAFGYASIGLTKDSIVHSFAEVKKQVIKMLEICPKVVLEEFIIGSEYSVLLVEKEDGSVIAYPPIQKQFISKDPLEQWMSFDSHWDEDEKPMDLSQAADSIGVEDKELEAALKEVAVKAFKVCQGNGFSRADIRRRDATGEIFILEVNDGCMIGPYSTSSKILQLVNEEPIELLEKIMRSRRRYKKLNEKVNN